MDLNRLQQEISAIGEKMVDCSNQCEGISRNLSEGILPRCLVLEYDDRVADKRGCAIIGINPGISKERERDFYKSKGELYEQFLAHWNLYIRGVKYYESLRRLVNNMGFSGPILWTELVKCENSGEELPTLQTFRTCTNSYLTKELNLLPKDWPLIGVGKESYKALAYLYPTRVVIGVPHPTGSYGHFPKLFDNNGELKKNLCLPFYKLWNDHNGLALWLDGK